MSAGASEAAVTRALVDDALAKEIEEGWALEDARAEWFEEDLKMGLVDDALKRQQDRNANYKPIDYDRMNKVLPSQKAALTRVKKTGDPEKIAQVIKAHIKVWNEIGAWPDQWHTWQVALNDALPYWQQIDLRDL